jgi:hypothetical protein
MRARQLSTLALLLVTGAAQAQVKINEITSVQVKDEGTTVSIVIQGTRPPNFTTFSMADPPRFVIDLSESRFQGVPPDIEVGDGFVNVIKNLSYGSDVTSIARVMIAFAVEVDPPETPETEGNTLVVRFQKPAGAAAVAKAEETDRKAKEEAEAKARAEAEAKARSDAEAQARIEAQEKARAEEALRAQQDREAADARAKTEQERRERELAEAKAQEEAAAQAAAEARAREVKARAEVAETPPAGQGEEDKLQERTPEVSRAERERLAREQAAADKQAAAERKAQEVADAKARAEEERQARVDSERQAREEARRAREEAAAEKRTAAEQAAADKKAAAEAAAAERRAEAERRKQEAADRTAAAEQAKAEKRSAAEAAAAERRAEAERKKQEAADAKARAKEERLARAEAAKAEREAARLEREAARAGGSDRLTAGSPVARLKEIGFKQLPGTSRVFVRTDVTPRFTIQDVGENVVRVEFENTRVARRNDTRFMDTSFFPSAVALITPSRQGSSYVVEIKLKQRVPYQQKVEGDLLAIDFERPTTAPAAPAAPTSGEAPPAGGEPAAEPPADEPLK